MTNAEYIREMDDGALAKFLLDMEEGRIDYSLENCRFCNETDCTECMEWWLDADTKYMKGLEWISNI